MKRFLTYLVCALFVMGASNLSAVEKKDKDKKKTAVESQKSSQKTDSAKQQTPKKYDTFVDQNGNGIDDRKENLRTKKQADTTKTSTAPK